MHSTATPTLSMRLVGTLEGVPVYVAPLCQLPVDRQNHPAPLRDSVRLHVVSEHNELLTRDDLARMGVSSGEELLELCIRTTPQLREAYLPHACLDQACTVEVCAIDGQGYVHVVFTVSGFEP
jgi:hypothetical protein